MQDLGRRVLIGACGLALGWVLVPVPLADPALVALPPRRTYAPLPFGVDCKDPVGDFGPTAHDGVEKRLWAYDTFAWACYRNRWGVDVPMEDPGGAGASPQDHLKDPPDWAPCWWDPQRIQYSCGADYHLA